MSQSLHAIPTPHFGCHFDGHMNVEPFAQQQENEGLNLNRKKPVTHAAEHDQKEDVKAEHQLQEKAQGFETKKSSAAPESDAEDGTDVKRLKDAFTDNNNKNQSASDDIKPLGARPLQDVINERRISQGRRPLTNEDYRRQHCPRCHPFCKPQPPTAAHPDLLAPLYRHHPPKQETDYTKISIPMNRRFRALPEPPPPIDPQKAWDNFYKIHPHLKRPA